MAEAEPAKRTRQSGEDIEPVLIYSYAKVLHSISTFQQNYYHEPTTQKELKIPCSTYLKFIIIINIFLFIVSAKGFKIPLLLKGT